MVTLFCRSLSMFLMNVDWSPMYWTLMLPGQLFCASATTAFTAATVSMRLAPARFDTSMTTAGLR